MNVGSYDRNAQRYFDHVAGETAAPSADRAGLRLFAELVGPNKAVLDVGCGPGHITAFLADAGLSISGVDISPAMIELAQSSFPHINFRLGDQADLPFATASLDGVVSRHSIIHTPPEQLSDVVAEFARVLRRGSLLFVSFFAAADPSGHGLSFDHAVCLAYQFDPNRIAAMLADHGFAEEVRIVRQPRPEERQLPHATLFARRALHKS